MTGFHPLQSLLDQVGQPKRSVSMPSAVIRRFNYAPERRELIVELVTGRRYLYTEVPEHEVQAFRSAFAKGVHFNRHIRGRYPYRELTEAD